jgi:hypothetical protein
LSTQRSGTPLTAVTTAARSAALPGVPAVTEFICIEFIDENGGGPGVRLKKRPQKKNL